MKCWVQSIQMRRSRALIHPAFLAPDGMSGEVRQWRDLSFLLRLCPFFMCDSLGAYSRRRTILTSRHLVVLLHLIVFFLSFCFAVSRYLVVPSFIASLFLFFHYVLHFHRYIFRTHAALRAILAFQIFSVHFVFLQGSHAFRYRKSVYASRCPSYFIFQRFHIKGRIAKTTHEGKTRKCTGCDTSIQPGVH